MKTLSSKFALAARLILGLVFFVFGLNGFLHFLPQPPAPPAAAAFAGALFASGYFFPLLKSVEVLAGALLLAGLFVPLALTALAPIIVNIAAFHLFLAPGNYAVVGLILAAEIYLGWAYRASFAPLLAMRARPHAVGADAGAGAGATPRRSPVAA